MILDYQLIFGVDKQMHVLLFTIISVVAGTVIILLSARGVALRNLSYLWITLVTSGIAEEYRQYMLPTRSAEFLDAIANMIGVTIGIFIPWLIAYGMKHKTHSFFKHFRLYTLFLFPLFLVLIYFNEIPFVTFEKPLQQKVDNIFVSIGLMKE
ncbi:hypothetical protein CIL05_03495 [Virgibacillus profundi]|uniref:VanZ-like domain-containing protein n=1 Tax=Virgibacillus profundi TaxID=2024555 RepID=A0A2A2IGM1_9BACI|nr:VanZ family protein [Virgibacillus profundi]PAV30797.1 hypothetical protein CIL05_03495 [Virgibacillus profundi]PXY54980.1 hypothetical protein CIT14_03575 [Virgibacillus profundi]